MAQALSQLTSALDQLHIRYLVGGSLASSAHGVFRATLDGDLVAAISPAHAKPLAKALGPAWYADPDMIEQSLRSGRSFNMIHMGSALKFDVFPALTDFHEAQLARAKVILLRLEGAAPCPVATREDILLAKLRWYSDGGEVSERQWNDILGLLALRPPLDFDYVEAWAARLDVSGLLKRARDQVNRDQPL